MLKHYASCNNSLNNPITLVQHICSVCSDVALSEFKMARFARQIVPARCCTSQNAILFSTTVHFSQREGLVSTSCSFARARIFARLFLCV